MQHGVRAETARLQRRVLRDTRVHLTIAGRSDIRHGRVDPRVLVTLEYLANSFHKVGVSDLVSGGALFSRSGSVSAHLYGRAADVASLHGKKVRGHQGPGTMTEQAIRKLLLLPKSLRPRQVISLMDVDGPDRATTARSRCPTTTTASRSTTEPTRSGIGRRAPADAPPEPFGRSCG